MIGIAQKKTYVFYAKIRQKTAFFLTKIRIFVSFAEVKIVYCLSGLLFCPSWDIRRMIKKCKWGQIKCLHRWRELLRRGDSSSEVFFFISPLLLFWYFFCVVLPRVYDLFAECGRNDINLTVWPKETINPKSSQLTSLNITQSQSPKKYFRLIPGWCFTVLVINV